MRQPGTTRRLLIRASATLLVLLAASGAAYAWSRTTNNPGNSITASSLGTPGSPAAATTNACVTVNVTWTAAANADRYQVEVKTANTAYTVLAASQATLSYNDATAYTNRDVRYRITPLLSGTSWTGTPVTASILCGIGEVSDVVASNPCNDTRISWTAAAGATNYDVWRKVNAGAFTMLTTAPGQAGTTYTDATVHPAGATVQYYVVPGNGAVNGNQSNISTVSNWSQFQVSSIVFGNGTTLGTIDGNDTITVTFNKASDGVTPGGTDNNKIFVQIGPTRGVYFPASAVGVGTTAIGQAIMTANVFGVSASYTGTQGWNAPKTVWTWTKAAGAGTTMAAPTWAATNFAVGTAAANPSRVKCSDGAGNLIVSVPAISGRF